MLVNRCTFLGVVEEDWFSLSMRGFLLAGGSTSDSLALALPLLSGVKESLTIE